MKTKHFKVLPSCVGLFIASCIRLQNFKSVKYRGNKYTLTFSARVQDISQDYSNYLTIELSLDGSGTKQLFTL